METRLIRKGSLGIAGTLKNAEHHAQPAIPLVKAMIDEIHDLTDLIKVWHQGHNIHVIESHDGRKIAFRPYRDVEGEWGIEILIKMSRQLEYPLFQIKCLRDVFTASSMIQNIFSVKQNKYLRMGNSVEE
jgi:hypothetical protein